jgi:hypothetical protein
MSEPRAVSKHDVKEQLELACTLTVNTTPEAHLAGMMACIVSYRDFIQENIQKAGGVDGPTFVSWMESATRDPEEFPEPWGAGLIRQFDEVLISTTAAGLQPAVVVEALDEWCEETREEVEAVHGPLEGGDAE